MKLFGTIEKLVRAMLVPQASSTLTEDGTSSLWVTTTNLLLKFSRRISTTVLTYVVAHGHNNGTYDITLTTSADTNVTLPTSGTIPSSSQAVTLNPVSASSVTLTVPNSGTLATLAGTPEEFTGKKLTGGAADTNLQWTLPYKAGTAGLSTVAGNIMFDTTAGVNKIKVYDGTSWKVAGGGLQPVAVTPSGNAVAGTVSGNMYLVNMAGQASTNVTIALPTGAAGDTIGFETHGNQAISSRILFNAQSGQGIVSQGVTAAGPSETITLLPCDPAWVVFYSDGTNWYPQGQATFVSGTFAGNLAVTGNETVAGTLGVTGLSTLTGGLINGATASWIELGANSGHGSTYTKIRKLSALRSSGTAITHTGSSTDGSSLTINETGLYFVSYTDSCSTGAGSHGISKNITLASEGSTAVLSLTESKVVVCTESPTDIDTNCSALVYLAANDVLRAQTSGSENRTAAPRCKVLIVQVLRMA